MKKITLCIFVVISSLFATGQNQTEISAFIDTTNTIKEINTYQDTLWVMDSSHFYNSIDYNLQISGKYNVLTRDETGNKLTGLGRNYYYGPIENSYLDSTTYFAGTADIHYNKRYSWSFDDYKWMDNNYQLYDRNYNMIDQYIKGWRTYLNEYIDGSRRTYDIDDRIRTSIDYNYLPESNGWEPYDKQVNYLNVLDKDSIELNQEWDILNNQWVNLSMNKRYYNAQEKESLRLYLIWDIETEQWTNQYKNEAVYNDSLNYLDYYGSTWDEVLNSWVNDIHRHHEHTENGQTDSTTVYNWDTIINDWVYASKSITLFNETGQILYISSMIFDNQSSRWMNDLKITYLYDDNNFERIIYNGDSISNEWVPYYREFQSYIYDNVSDTIQYDSWDTISQQWIFSHRHTYDYDQRFNQTNSISEMWNISDDTWQIMQQTNYFWSPFNPLRIPDSNPMNDQIKIYPNPTNSVFNIEVQSDLNPPNLMIELFDINGRSVLKSNQTSYSKQFDIKHLEKGIYMIKIQNNGDFITKRIVLQ